MAALLAGFLVLSFRARKNELDFSEYYAAAQMVRHGLGRELYDLGLQVDFQSRVATVHVFYNHPPFEALLFVPFTYFSYRTAYTLWTLLSLALLTGAAWLIESRTGVSLAVSQYARIPADFGLVLVIFLTFGPATTCLLLGQDSMLILFIYTLAFVLLQRGAGWRAGCVLACGLFKFHLVIPFAAILLLRRKWTAVGGFAAVGSLLVLLSLAISGWRALIAYPRLLLFNTTYQQIAGFAPEYMPNIRGILNLLSRGMLPRPILSLLLAGLSVGALWWTAKSWRDDQLGLSFSAAALATLLVSYHLYNYDLTLLLLPIGIVCGELARRGRLLASPWALTLSLIILFVPPLHRLLLLHGAYALMFLPVVTLFLVVVWLVRSDGAQDKPAGHRLKT